MAEKTPTAKLKCQKCRKSVSVVNELYCKHDICHACYINTKNKCPIRLCGKNLTGKRTKLKTANAIASENVSIKSLMQQADALEKKYQKELKRREDECINKTKELEESVKELQKEENNTLEDLKHRYNIGYKKLKQQFNGYEEEVKHAFSDRYSQMMKMLDDIKNLLIDIRDNTKETLNYFKSLGKEKGIDERCVNDIERKTREIETQTLEVDIPPMTIEIEQSDEDWSPKVIVQIDAPTPSIKTAPPPKLSKLNATDDPELSSMLGKKLHKEGEVSTNYPPLDLRIINNKLYSCEGDAELSVYSMDLTHERTIPAGDMEGVYAFTALEDGSLLVAAKIGLFTITNNDDLSKVADGDHCDVHYRDGQVYALNSSGEIHIYNLSNATPVNTPTITLPSRCDSFVLGSDRIYASDYSKPHVYVLSRDTGERLATHGRAGDDEPDQLNWQCVTQTDAAEDVLVCDGDNQRVKLMNKDGAFHVTSTDVLVSDPRSAVFSDRVLYVGSNSESKIYKFSV